ncbi:MAG TPA: MarR family transcriptional regulator [Acidimicrobiales bacterium]|nr:MarR family transcriptional regulator [Acidimicrobiales bacterium]
MAEVKPTATRWLTDSEQEVWRSLLGVTRLLFSQCDRELLEESGIPIGYYPILVLLSEAPDRAMRMSDLAEATKSLPSSISHAVGKLEADGWVERRHCSEDRRVWFAALTDVGFAALERAAPLHVESVRKHLFDLLTREQVDQLDTICNVLLAQFGDETKTVCPGSGSDCAVET